MFPLGTVPLTLLSSLAVTMSHHGTDSLSMPRPHSDAAEDTVSKAACRLSVLVVGGGIGGLAVAHCLEAAGHEVTVVERESTITTQGAGIQMGPNASRLLLRWGLQDELEKVALQPEAIVFKHCEICAAHLT